MNYETALKEHDHTEGPPGANAPSTIRRSMNIPLRSFIGCLPH